MTTRYWVGCSGFHYKHWRGLFYPKGVPQKNWFEFYLQHFNTLELNVTFYRFPRPALMENCYEKSPAEFKFSVKMNKAITHYKQFNDTAGMIADFYGTIKEGLKEKLGCVLFQLPPRTKYTPERLDKIINSLDLAFNNVLEFRHNSWWDADVFATMSKHNVGFCGMSHPEYPDNLIATTGTAYYRFHGVPLLYKSAYTERNSTGSQNKRRIWEK
ncbi:DUF72 domain-containing protein [Segetibacter sp. 3557_3]|uniref:DUF72 domain-containing protein n=1 Tax=Segetibacter sp. 3557_3 TaxID=2547429 RepID=UPI001A9EC2CF|nr:DUF72 domain-containing protein [Segetibacter sp. 3557_3]